MKGMRRRARIVIKADALCSEDVQTRVSLLRSYFEPIAFIIDTTAS